MGQLGVVVSDGASNPASIKEWTRLIQVPHLIGVSCGWDFSIAYTHSQVLVAGSNAFGQLSLGKDVKKCESFMEIPASFIASEGIESVSCGLRHTLFLTRQGNVYGLGHNRKGQLQPGGEDAGSRFHSPVLLASGGRQISAGQNFSLVLKEDGSLLAFGDNKWGQLSVPEESLLQVHAGWTHGVAVSQSRAVLAWGRDSYGQIAGNGLGPVNAISSGSEHVLALIGDELFSWGWNEHGNCGDGTTRNVKEPIRIVIPSGIHRSTIRMIRGGSGHSLAYITSSLGQ
eukprot:TRINITY_DN1430_c0_g1_i2.p1 TRINITY_DN1430_c0_g1~~TRINITY_DN1430_c0_g1_i2.p1  ORF type:complete len:285 (+),score=62.15 TRINITY_DN1430_c0_g1_i2:400-1254(+)